MFCPNCGSSLSEEARFCPSCGAAVQEEPAAPPNVQPSGNVQMGADGAWRWIYRMDLRRNAAFFWLAVKIFAICMGFFALLSAAVSLIQGSFDIWALLTPLLAGLFLLVILLISWGIYLVISGGAYWCMFTMDDKGVTQMQMDKTYERVQMLGLLAAALSSSPGARAGALGRSMAGSWRIDFASVRSVTLDRKHELIALKCSLLKYGVYAAPEDYGFVLEHIKSRVPQGAQVVEKR